MGDGWVMDPVLYKQVHKSESCDHRGRPEQAEMYMSLSAFMKE